MSKNEKIVYEAPSYKIYELELEGALLGTSLEGPTEENISGESNIGGFIDDEDNVFGW